MDYRDPLLLPSSKMKLPGAERATVDIAKLRDYCVNLRHPRGRHKARVFASALKLHQNDADFLRTQLLEAARTNEAIAGEIDEYGQRYSVDFEFMNGTWRGVVRSAWIVLANEDFPRLASCYIMLE